MEWSRLPLESPANAAPLARGGHSATLVRGAYGAKIIVFGGEDRRGRLLDDVHVVDLQTMRWSTPDSPLPARRPPPRGTRRRELRRGRRRRDQRIRVRRRRARLSGRGVGGTLRPRHDGDDVASRASRRRRPGAARVRRRRPSSGDAWYITGGGGADGGRRDTVALRVSAVDGEVEDERRGGGRGIVARRRGRGGGRRRGGRRVTRLRRVRRRAVLRGRARPETAAGGAAGDDQDEDSLAGEDGSSADQRRRRRVKRQIAQSAESRADVAGDEPRALARELEHTKTRLAETREALAGKEAETTRLRAALDEERAKVSRLEATLAETETATAESRRPKGVWGFLSGDAPGHKGSARVKTARRRATVDRGWFEDASGAHAAIAGVSSRRSSTAARFQPWYFTTSCARRKCRAWPYPSPRGTGPR